MSAITPVTIAVAVTLALVSVGCGEAAVPAESAPKDVPMNAFEAVVDPMDETIISAVAGLLPAES